VLEKNNYATRVLDLTGVAGELGLNSCDLVVVAAASEAFAPSSTERLIGAVRRGKSVLIASGPQLDEDNRARASGLEPLLDLFGVQPRQQMIFERDPALVVATGLGGEVFLAQPKPHAITQGLLEQGEARYRVLLSLAQGFGTTATATALLATSERAFAVADASLLVGPKLALDDVKHAAEGPFSVAMAAELPDTPGAEKRSARLVVLGSHSPLLGDTWQDPTRSGTRRFVESALSWLVSRPSLVSLPEKPERQVQLSFTEEAMTEVVRYVLLYMPGTALLLGALILYRRRATLRASPAARDEGGS
jgi:hypothetical protein